MSTDFIGVEGDRYSNGDVVVMHSSDLILVAVSSVDKACEFRPFFLEIELEV